MNILIFDDNLIQLSDLRQLLSAKYPDNWISCCSDFFSAIMAISNNLFDCFILNINIPDNLPVYNAITVGQYIRSFSHYKRTPILFLSSTSDRINYCLNELHCYSYINMPCSEGDLCHAIDILSRLALDSVQDHHDEYLCISSANNIYIPILFPNILYIESNHHCINIHCKDQTITTSKYSLSTISNILSPKFIRCHREYIVNLDFLENYDKTNRYVRIQKNTIPVGRNYKNDLEAQLKLI